MGIFEIKPKMVNIQDELFASLKRAQNKKHQI